MQTTPSIKGSVFSAVVEDVAKLLDRRELTREEASRWLAMSDFDVLEANILVGSWYDIRMYDRLNLLGRDVAGHGRNEYLREKGSETGRRLGEAGLYSQLEYVHRTQLARASDQAERFAAFGRDLRRLTTLSASILNFSRWEARPDPDHPMRYCIEVSDAADFPDTLAWRSDGLVNHMATQHGTPDLWTWTRPRQDLIVFRMTREA